MLLVTKNIHVSFGNVIELVFLRIQVLEQQPEDAANNERKDSHGSVIPNQ